MAAINTHLGPITGSTRDGCEVFLGIPYAQAPIGENRWMPPKTAAPWPDGLEATEHPIRRVRSNH